MIKLFCEKHKVAIKNSYCPKCKNEYDKEYRKKFPWRHIYNSLKQRCTNPEIWSYKWYGGKGVKCSITMEEIKELWFRDKAYNLKKPSIDRENNDGDYCFDNCKFIEMNKNSGKSQKKFILQYSLDGLFIKEWDCISDAERFVSGRSKGKLSLVAKGKQKSAFGFIWKYKS